MRAHELMLNEATSKLEHAALAPLSLLNGGALVAFLTLLGALLGKDSGWQPEFALAGVAIGAWGVGLVAAATALHYASAEQAKISAAHRTMREAIERALYPENFAGLLEGLPPDETAPLRPGDIATRLRAKLLRSRAPVHGRPPESQAASPDETERESCHGDVRKTLHDISDKNAARRRAFWRLSISMFVLGAGLALSAVLGGETAKSKAIPHPSRHPVVTRVEVESVRARPLLPDGVDSRWCAERAQIPARCPHLNCTQAASGSYSSRSNTSAASRRWASRIGA